MPNERVKVQTRIILGFFRKKIDRLIVYRSQRWISFAVVLSLFILKMILLSAYFAVAYILGFYIMHNFILYLTPSTLPSIQDEEEAEENVYEIPEVVLEHNEDSSKPIVRKLGEFKLWKKLFFATSLCLSLTFFKIFDFPVFWQILLLYFIFIMTTIILRQRAHMKKYGYSMSDFFKKEDRKLVIN